MDLNHYSGPLGRVGSCGLPSDAGDDAPHVSEISSSTCLLGASHRNADCGTVTLGVPCRTIDRSHGISVGLGGCFLSMVLVAVFAFAPLSSHAQESVRIRVKEGSPATTAVSSYDASVPVYTVRARVHREGGLPLNWLVNHLVKKLGSIGGAKAGAAAGGLAGVPVGLSLGGTAGWLGGKIGEYLGDELEGNGRCGVDIDIEVPSSSTSLRADWAYGGIWMVDIPFDFGGLFKLGSSTLLSVAEAIPTTGPWGSREYVRVGSTLDITADDSLCYRASLDAEFEYGSDCDLYCDTTAPDAICPARCRAFEMEFVRIPAGSFLMGSRERTDEERQAVPFDDRPYPHEGPQHSRSVGQFSLGKYEVTQAQWQAVMGSPPRCFVEECESCPVVCVSWADTQEFIGKLNVRESESGYRYRLPTEAEWEYAARAGTTGVRYGQLDEIAWYEGNSGRSRHPVGEKQANAWGLHDMLGNVAEWTADWYQSYPGADDEFDFTGLDRVVRGGSWEHGARSVRAAERLIGSPGTHSYYVTSRGFRLVRTE